MTTPQNPKLPLYNVLAGGLCVFHEGELAWPFSVAQRIAEDCKTKPHFAGMPIAVQEQFT